MVRWQFRGRLYGVVALCALAFAACGQVIDVPTDGLVCDGVEATVGGCDAPQPSFVATDCPTVAKEFAAQLLNGIDRIESGPAIEKGNGRSVRLQFLTSLLAVRAMQHLSRSTTGACDPPAFQRVIEDALDPGIQQRIVAIAYPDASGTYDTWREDLRTFVRLVGGATVPSTPSPSG